MVWSQSQCCSEHRPGSVLRKYTWKDRLRGTIWSIRIKLRFWMQIKHPLHCSFFPASQNLVFKLILASDTKNCHKMRPFARQCLLIVEFVFFLYVDFFFSCSRYWKDLARMSSCTERTLLSKYNPVFLLVAFKIARKSYNAFSGPTSTAQLIIVNGTCIEC